MPSHLHPRSRYTTSLFGATLLVSFLVVGMPHLLPCPAPRTEFADVQVMEDGRRRRRRRQGPDRLQLEDSTSSEPHLQAEDTVIERDVLAKRGHECPVPKPRGLIGEVMGFPREGNAGKPSRTNFKVDIVDDSPKGNG
ncbi:hypothetical protein MMC09_006952 [Bachmanniomyces sp. S44760]|nr:hypothetical protein [Bachmanniomyces sp. S44760]